MKRYQSQPKYCSNWKFALTNNQEHALVDDSDVDLAGKYPMMHFMLLSHAVAASAII